MIFPIDRMVENVECFETRLEIARLVVADVELLQDAGVGGEDARVAQVGEEHRRVG